MPESFGLIESGVLFGVSNSNDLIQYSLFPKDFSIHGDAYQFLLNYHDEYKSYPTAKLLKEKYPELDEEAKSLDFHYCARTLQNQSLTRRASELIRSQSPVMVEDPKKAISNILYGLDSLSSNYDDSI